ncbi:hypothetical protein P154DRAFT_581403 [Amniculicola lignicola CBS 123094]|uniref:Uncharacterized protein n=1 Tax=Amniculicola lignicola CBS 123094 TaxID=1392246 RepID=A0A6A5W0X8_9PLEO|nr:hypothetical protein P154DRAFT_581403 [Amniculicola lignicola CBS 123094]
MARRGWAATANSSSEWRGPWQQQQQQQQQRKHLVFVVAGHAAARHTHTKGRRAASSEHHASSIKVRFAAMPVRRPPRVNEWPAWRRQSRAGTPPPSLRLYLNVPDGLLERFRRTASYLCARIGLAMALYLSLTAPVGHATLVAISSSRRSRARSWWAS